MSTWGGDTSVSARLPDFPWDHLSEHATLARSHHDGIVNLSVGTPVDPTPEVAQRALTRAADRPGYPMTIGEESTRQACIDWLMRRAGAIELDLEQVLPVIGSKELIGSLALHLGLGSQHLIAFPELAYPTYQVGAVLAGAKFVATDSLAALDTINGGPPALLWINSPSNPTGRVASREELRWIVDWCRERETLLVSDECYLECAWDAEPVSVLHPDVCGGSSEGVLAVHSLSKRSNLAGYRCAFVAGDRHAVAELLAVRKNLGLQMPGPQQSVMAEVLADDEHAETQHALYADRRARLRSALETAGFRIDHSQASLYLWATRGEDCWKTVAELAALGVLVAPGSFYGGAGSQHVRVAFTATDERIDAAVQRLTNGV